MDRPSGKKKKTKYTKIKKEVGSHTCWMCGSHIKRTLTPNHVVFYIFIIFKARCWRLQSLIICCMLKKNFLTHFLLEFYARRRQLLPPLAVSFRRRRKTTFLPKPEKKKNLIFFS